MSQFIECRELCPLLGQCAVQMEIETQRNYTVTPNPQSSIEFSPETYDTFLRGLKEVAPQCQENKDKDIEKKIDDLLVEYQTLGQSSPKIKAA